MSGELSGLVGEINALRVARGASCPPHSPLAPPVSAPAALGPARAPSPRRAPSLPHGAAPTAPHLPDRPPLKHAQAPACWAWRASSLHRR